MQYFNTHHFTDQEPVVELVNQYPWEFDEKNKNILDRNSSLVHKIRKDSKYSSNRTKIVLDSCLAMGNADLINRIDIPMELQQSVF
jgi:TatD DNase family protein